MLPKYTPRDLRTFENEIANIFNNGEIRAPIHLYSNNEKEMIEIFEVVKPQDWVFCSWRSHYQCLLKGVPKHTLLTEIMAGKSISLCFPKYKIYSSAIVGGVIPVAVGAAVALGISWVLTRPVSPGMQQESIGAAKKME